MQFDFQLRTMLGVGVRVVEYCKDDGRDCFTQRTNRFSDGGTDRDMSIENPGSHGRWHNLNEG